MRHVVGAELVQKPIDGGAGGVVEDARGWQASVLAPDPVAGDASGVHGPEPTRSRSGYVLEDTRAKGVVVLPPGLLGWPASTRKNGFRAAFLLPCASGRS